MENVNRWYFTKDQLADSPSRKCAIDEARELSYRQQAANFIQDMGQRLQASQLCINTAIVYMHRFYVFHSFLDIHRNNLSISALFLAAKVEEQPRKLEHIIKVAHGCLVPKDATKLDSKLDVKSEPYANMAFLVVAHENILLQTLGFVLAIEHPHTYVVKVCQLVKASKDLAQTSYIMATTSLHMTTMCLQYKPTVVACVCIHLACKWSSYMIEPCSEGRDWFYYVDRSVTWELLETLTQEFIAILETSPHRFKRRYGQIDSGYHCPKNIMDDNSQDKHTSSMENKMGLAKKKPIASPQPSTSLSFTFCPDFDDKHREYKSPEKSSHSSKSTSSSEASSMPQVSSTARPHTPTLPSSTSQPQLEEEKKPVKVDHSISLATYREKREKSRLALPLTVPPPVVESTVKKPQMAPHPERERSKLDTLHSHPSKDKVKVTSLFVKEKPPNVREKPHIVRDKLPVVKEKPPIIKEKPSPIVREKPPIVKEKPPIIKEKPPIVKEKPSIVQPQPPNKLNNQLPKVNSSDSKHLHVNPVVKQNPHAPNDAVVMLERVDVKKEVLDSFTPVPISIPAKTIEPPFPADLIKKEILSPLVTEDDSAKSKQTSKHRPNSSLHNSHVTDEVTHSNSVPPAMHSSRGFCPINMLPPPKDIKTNGSKETELSEKQPIVVENHVKHDHVSKRSSEGKHHERRERHKSKHSSHSKDRTNHSWDSNQPMTGIKVKIRKDIISLSGVNPEANAKYDAPMKSLKIKLPKPPSVEEAPLKVPKPPSVEEAPLKVPKPQSLPTPIKLVLTKDKSGSGSYSTSRKHDRKRSHDTSVADGNCKNAYDAVPPSKYPKVEHSQKGGHWSKPHKASRGEYDSRHNDNAYHNADHIAPVPPFPYMDPPPFPPNMPGMSVKTNFTPTLQPPLPPPLPSLFAPPPPPE